MHCSALPADVAKAVVGLSGLKATIELERQIDDAIGLSISRDEYAAAAPSQVMIEAWDLNKEVEPWNSMPTAELWKSLGPLEAHELPDGSPHTTIYGMAACRDPLGLATSWGRADGKPWWTDPTIPERRKVPLTLSHHQLVGLRKSLQWLTNGEGGLIADEVGVGKTAQVITLVQYREQLLHQQRMRIPFPPGLGELSINFILYCLVRGRSELCRRGGVLPASELFRRSARTTGHSQRGAENSFL